MAGGIKVSLPTWTTTAATSQRGPMSSLSGATIIVLSVIAGGPQALVPMSSAATNIQLVRVIICTHNLITLCVSSVSEPLPLSLAVVIFITALTT